MKSKPIHMFSPEFPPDVGGVSHYALLVANGLVDLGHKPEIWSRKSVSGQPQEECSFPVHRVRNSFSPSDLTAIDRLMDATADSKVIFLHWVPHGYGFKAINLYFCYWMRRRVRKYKDRLCVMVHEPYVPFSGSSIRSNFLSLMQRWMLSVILSDATHVLVSCLAFKQRIERLPQTRRIGEIICLPIPSTIPSCVSDIVVRQRRRSLAVDSRILVGHFGTYGTLITNLLLAIIPRILVGNRIFLLIGRSSDRFREHIVKTYPTLAKWLVATGDLTSEDVGIALKSCDLMVQPYVDGATTRRTSLMAALRNGTPVVTTIGPLSEAFWEEESIVACAPVSNLDVFISQVDHLCSDAGARRVLGRRGKSYYDSHFALSRTINILDQILS